jgi:hypothetical protein
VQEAAEGQAVRRDMWVVKTEDDGIFAHCVVCKTEEAFVHTWQVTEWADGMMEAVPVAGTVGRLDSAPLAHNDQLVRIPPLTKPLSGRIQLHQPLSEVGTHNARPGGHGNRGAARKGHFGRVRPRRPDQLQV